MRSVEIKAGPAGVVDVTIIPVYAASSARTLGVHGNLIAGLQGFEGRSGQVMVGSQDDRPAVFVGLGVKGEVRPAELLSAARTACLSVPNARSVDCRLLDGLPAHVNRRDAASAVAEGIMDAAYSFDQYATRERPGKLESAYIHIGREKNHCLTGIERGRAIAEAVSLARDLVNQAPSELTPTRLAEIAEAEAAKSGLLCEIFDENILQPPRFAGLPAVSSGSTEPPRLICLRYEPAGASQTVALVGKGITFDSGGLTLKPRDGMQDMKADMAGAAAVISVMRALRDCGCKLRVLGFAACAENMPGPAAMKLGDVLKFRNGKSVEILNTDAEGRLVLADALIEACDSGSDAVIDLATLTGAAVVALGEKVAAVMSNSFPLVRQLIVAGERVGETYWELPLFEPYRKSLRSMTADLANVGKSRDAGAIVAGLFLREFVGKTPWAHIDIAGPGMLRADSQDGPAGATGFGVRTLLALLESPLELE